MMKICRRCKCYGAAMTCADCTPTDTADVPVPLCKSCSDSVHTGKASTHTITLQTLPTMDAEREVCSDSVNEAQGEILDVKKTVICELSGLKKDLDDSFALQERLLRATVVSIQAAVKEHAIALRNSVKAEYSAVSGQIECLLSRVISDCKDLSSLSQIYAEISALPHVNNRFILPSDSILESIKNLTLINQPEDIQICVPPPNLQPDTEIRCSLADSITAQGTFWILPQLSDETHTVIHKMSLLIRQEMLRRQRGTNSRVGEIEEGDAVFVKYSRDQMWYRGFVEQVKNQDSINVRLSDIGLCITTTAHNVHSAQPNFYPNVAFQAVPCCLYPTIDDISLPLETRWLFNDTVKATDAMITCKIINTVNSLKNTGSYKHVDLILERRGGEKERDKLSMFELIDASAKKLSTGKDSIKCRDIRYTDEELNKARYIITNQLSAPQLPVCTNGSAQQPASSSSLNKESGDSLSKESGDSSLIKESGDSSLSKEHSGSSLSKESGDSSLSKEHSGSSLSKKHGGSSVSKEPGGSRGNDVSERDRRSAESEKLLAVLNAQIFYGPVSATGNVPKATTAAGNVPRPTTVASNVPSATAAAGNVPHATAAADNVPKATTAAGDVPPSTTAAEGNETAVSVADCNRFNSNFISAVDNWNTATTGAYEGRNTEVSSSKDVSSISELQQSILISRLPKYAVNSKSPRQDVPNDLQRQNMPCDLIRYDMPCDLPRHDVPSVLIRHSQPSDLVGTFVGPPPAINFQLPRSTLTYEPPRTSGCVESEIATVPHSYQGPLHLTPEPYQLQQSVGSSYINPEPYQPQLQSVEPVNRDQSAWGSMANDRGDRRDTIAMNPMVLPFQPSAQRPSVHQISGSIPKQFTTALPRSPRYGVPQGSIAGVHGAPQGHVLGQHDVPQGIVLEQHGVPHDDILKMLHYNNQCNLDERVSSEMKNSSQCGTSCIAQCNETIEAKAGVSSALILSQPPVSLITLSQPTTYMTTFSQPALSRPTAYMTALSQPALSQPALSQLALSQPAAAYMTTLPQPELSQPTAYTTALSQPLGHVTSNSHWFDPYDQTYYSGSPMTPDQSAYEHTSPTDSSVYQSDVYNERVYVSQCPLADDRMYVPQCPLPDYNSTANNYNTLLNSSQAPASDNVPMSSCALRYDASAQGLEPPASEPVEIGKNGSSLVQQSSKQSTSKREPLTESRAKFLQGTRIEGRLTVGLDRSGRFAIQKTLASEDQENWTILNKSLKECAQFSIGLTEGRVGQLVIIDKTVERRYMRGQIVSINSAKKVTVKQLDTGMLKSYTLSNLFASVVDKINTFPPQGVVCRLPLLADTHITEDGLKVFKQLTTDKILTLTVVGQDEEECDVPVVDLSSGESGSSLIHTVLQHTSTACQTSYPSVCMPSVDQPSDTTRVGVRNVENEVKSKNKPWGGYESTQHRETICYQCNQPGHKKRECPGNSHHGNSSRSNHHHGNRGGSSRGGARY